MIPEIEKIDVRESEVAACAVVTIVLGAERRLHGHTLESLERRAREAGEENPAKVE